jgi:hypothetical protein
MALLHGMRDLVGEQVRSGWIIRSVLSRTEVNVVTDGEGAGS